VFAGAVGLGIHGGDTVVGEQFERIYGHWQDTRDPSGQALLGAPPRKNAEVERLFLAKVADHPEATGEQCRRLCLDARTEVTGSGVLYYDHVFGPDKTISLAHAAATAAAQAAREAGDLREYAR